MIASGAAGVISVIGNALPKAFSRMIRLEFRGEYEQPVRFIILLQSSTVCSLLTVTLPV